MLRDGVGPLFRGVAWRPPDGAANSNETQAALFAFQAVGAYPHTTWLDFHGGQFAGAHLDQTMAPPNYVVTCADIQFSQGAMTGRPYPFSDPGDCPNPPTSAPPGGNITEITLVPSSELLDAGEPVNVDVFVDSVDSLGAYEIKLKVTGGTGGTLLLTGITVDTQRGDYVFTGESPAVATQVGGNRMGAALPVGEGVGVSTSGYLATYTFQPAQGAPGYLPSLWKRNAA